TNAARIEKLIEGDPALASKVLSLANSAYYGLPQRVTTISRAVVIMGFQELQILAVGAGLAEVFELDRSPAGLDGEALWVHCLSVSWLARELAAVSGYPLPAEIMVAGLLHDLGKLVLATHMLDELARLLDLCREGRPYFQAEEQLGLRHTIIGFWLARRWGLPGLHEAVIRDHHLPLDTGPYYLATCLVHLADRLVKDLGFGLVHEARPADLSPVLRATGLSREQIEAAGRNAEEYIPSVLGAWRAILSRSSVN
ncbi:MAG: HDOD domain-containing protein, partial [Thermodesulfobacteriota bacterium]